MITPGILMLSNRRCALAYAEFFQTPATLCNDKSGIHPLLH